MKAKRILAIALAVLMALAAVPALAKTASDEKEDTRLHESYFNDPTTGTYFNYTDENVAWLNRSTDTYNYIESGNAGTASSRSTIKTASVYMYEGEYVSFQYWYSTEENYDFFMFYVNDYITFDGSGESNGWASYTYTIPSDGFYVFKWEYLKDSSNDVGSDCVRLAYCVSSAHWHDYRERAGLAATGGGLRFAAEDPSVYAFGVRSSDQESNPLYLRSTNGGAANSVCRLQATATVPSADTQTTKYISFDYAVECEANYDKLRFLIDDGVVLTESGTGDFSWKHAQFEVPSGTHTFTWEYTKDSSVDGGSDCAAIDNIRLENYAGAMDRYINFSAYVKPETHAQLIFNTPAGSEGFATTQPRLINNNRYIDSSSSCFETAITMAAGEHLSFDYIVSSESYDKLYFKVDGSTVITASGWEDTSIKHSTFTAPSTRTYTFRWEYVKDGSISKGWDLACIFNILYDGEYFGNITAADINDMLNHPDTDDPLQFIGGAGVGGWFMPYIDSERTALVSMNKYYESTLSSIGTTSYMSEGDRLTFDYMVSSEYDCDTFSFNVYLGDEEVFSIERSGDQVWHEYEYVFEQSGDYHFGWSYFKDISVNEGDDCAMIDNVRITRAGDPPMPSLDEALNPDGSDPETWLSFSSGGSYPFIVDCDANGRLFAVSTNQGAANSSSSVSTGGVFADGAVLHFEYQISSEANYDGLIFCDNGSEVFSDSGTGNTNWQTFTYVLTGGWHDLEWTYSKDQSANAGEDCVRLDNVYTTWTPPVEGIPGDVDGNGTVTVSDAIMALRCAMGILTLTPEQFARADIDGSSTVTVSDAIMILRTAMGLL